jgi:HK97 family phage portal protein
MPDISTITRPAKWLLDWLNGTREDGTTSKAITANEIISTAPAWYAVNKICGHVGQLPLGVYRRVNNGRDMVRNHIGSQLMRVRPNRIQQPIVFKGLIQTHALLWGNGRAYIHRDPMGQPIELIPLMPDRTDTFLWKGNKYHITQPYDHDRIRLFENLTSENTVVMDDADVLHIPGLGFDGIKGKSLMTVAKESFSIGIGADQRAARQMRKGFNGQVMLQDNNGRLRNIKDAEEFLDHFRKQHNSDKQAQDVGLLLEGMTASVLSMSNKDAEFLQTRQNQREEAALWFGIESILGDNSTSYNSLEQKNLAYLSGCLATWLTKWEQECNAKLLTDAERVDEEYYFKFNTGALLRTDFATTVTTLGNGIAMRIFSPNEAREKLDMNTYEGGDAFENPAITPGATGATQDNLNTNATARLEHMLGIEQKRVQGFIDSGKSIEQIAKWYDGWKDKLGDVIENELGGDRGIANEHCQQSLDYIAKGRKTFDLTGTAELLAEQITKGLDDV